MNLNELFTRQLTQTPARGHDELVTRAQEAANLQIDPQVSMLQRRERDQAVADLNSAISRGAGRSGVVDWNTNQRNQYYGDQFGMLEAQRGAITNQQLMGFEDRDWTRGQDHWNMAMQVHDRTMLTPLQRHQLNLGYAESAGEFPKNMLDQYGGFGPPKTDGNTTAPAQTTPTTGSKSYQVKPGDSLHNIARVHGTTIEQIMKLNPHIKNANMIYSGHTIILP